MQNGIYEVTALICNDPIFLKKNRWVTYFYIFGGHMSLCGATGTPVLDF